MDCDFVDTRESENLKESLWNVGAAVHQVHDYTVGDIADGMLEGFTSFIIPELEVINLDQLKIIFISFLSLLTLIYDFHFRALICFFVAFLFSQRGSFFAALNADDILALKQFTENGGTVIISGSNRYFSNHDVIFLNGVWGYRIEHYKGFACQPAFVSYAMKTDQADATPFAKGPEWVPYNSAIYCLKPSSLPEDAVELYSDGRSTWAARMNHGSIVYLGFDWWTLYGIERWEQVLDASLDSSDLACTPPPTSAPTRSFCSKDVAILLDRDFVDFAESDNLLHSLDEIGIKPHEIRHYNAGMFASGFLDDYSTLVIPELEVASFLPALSTGDITKLNEFVDNGGTIVLGGSNKYGNNHDLIFLNGVFASKLGGREVRHYTGPACSCYYQDYAWRTFAATGTPFANGPSWVPYVTTVYCLDPNTLPADGVTLYSDGAATWAARMFNGAVVYLGFDWYQKCYIDEWETLLNIGIDSTDVNCAPPTIGGTNHPTHTPTLSPTFEPTFAPTLVPTHSPTFKPSLHPTVEGEAIECVRNVMILMDCNFVDFRESTNMYFALKGRGFDPSRMHFFHTGDFESGILNEFSTFVVPELEVGDFLPYLNQGDKDALNLFVQRGGTIIVGGANRNNNHFDLKFLNGVFAELNLVHYSGRVGCGYDYYDNSASITAAAATTPFATAPDWIGYHSAVYCLESSSLPAGSTDLYSDGHSSWAARMLGGGVVYLGFDWWTRFNTDRWDDLLKLAVDSSDSVCEVAPTAAPTRTACSQDVLILMDCAFVDFTESTNLRNSLISNGLSPVEIHTYNTGAFAAGLLDTVSTFVVPEMEQGSFLPVLSEEDKAKLVFFTQSGGTIIIGGSNRYGFGYDVLFLNTVFGLTLQHYDGSACHYAFKSWAGLTEGTAGTRFANGPDWLPWASKIYCLVPESLDASDSTPLYSDGYTVWAARMLSGSIVYLGFDWWQVSNVGRWIDLLNIAVDSSDLACQSTPSFAPTYLPSFSPSFEPSFLPTFTPTFVPTLPPTFTPTLIPTFMPSRPPTEQPTLVPSSATPSFAPTMIPTKVPTVAPTFRPTEVGAVCERRALFFQDFNYVDSYEAGNLEQSLIEVGVPFDSLDKYTTGDFASGILNNYANLVMPELEVASFLPALSEDDKHAIRAFVANGGTVIIGGANRYGNAYDLEFLNAVFSLKLKHYIGFACSESFRSYADKTEAADSTMFAAGPEWVPYANAIYCLKTSSLPAGSMTLYSDGYSTWAARMLKGGVVFLGFDWWTTRGVDRWDNVLKYSLNSNDDACKPVPTAAPTRSSCSKDILLLMDHDFVDFAESDNMKYSLQKIGITPKEIRHYDTGDIENGLLDTFSTFIIPELEISSFYDHLSLGDAAALNDFIDGGGTIIIGGANSHGNNFDLTFINGVFHNRLDGKIIEHYSGHACNAYYQDYAVKTQETEDTPFEFGPTWVPYVTTVYCINPRTLPSDGKSLYSDGHATWAARMFNGAVVYLGFDWFQKSYISEWEALLDLGIDSSDIQCGESAIPITRAPTKSPTRTPTQQPSIEPSHMPTFKPTLHPTTAGEDKECIRAVLVFLDRAYMNHRESNNLFNTLNNNGFNAHQVNKFRPGDFAGGILDEYSTFVVPELQKRNLFADLTLGDIDALNAFVARGGTLIIAGANEDSLNYDLIFLNGVFASLNLRHATPSCESTSSSGSSSSSSSTSSSSSSSCEVIYSKAYLTAAAAGTPFATGPDWVPFQRNVYFLDVASLPVGSTDLYNDGQVSWAARMLDGGVVYLGFDWFSRNSINRWVNVLRDAVDSADNTCMISPTAAPTRSMCSKDVLILMDSAFVDYTESTNLRNALESLGVDPVEIHSFVTDSFASGGLDAYSTFVVPELEVGSLLPHLSYADKSALVHFTNNGGTIVIGGANRHRNNWDLIFLNNVFGTSLEHYSGGACHYDYHNWASKTSAALETPFAVGPDWIPWASTIYCLVPTSLPHDDSTSLYSDGFATWAARMLRGSIVYLGFDFWQISNVEHWYALLDIAIDSSDVGCNDGSPTELPTFRPTRSPTIAPTFFPTVYQPCESKTLILKDYYYVDFRESENMRNTLLLAGADPVNLNHFNTGDLCDGLLDDYTNFIIPELENGSLQKDLSECDKLKLKQFASNGGTVIIAGANRNMLGYDVDLINDVFGLELEHYATGISCESDFDGVAYRTQYGLNSPFYRGPRELPWRNAIYCLDLDTVPNESDVMYGDDTTAWVTRMFNGSLVYIGFDFWHRSHIEPWEEILVISLDSSDLSCTSPPPTVVPTAQPTSECSEACLSSCNVPSASPTASPTYDCPYPPLTYPEPNDEEVRLVFDSIDLNGDGELDEEELFTAMSQPGCICCILN